MMSNNNNNNNSGSGNAPLAYFIGHIPRGATEAEVEKVFAPHGTSPQFHMHRDNEGRSRGFGWLRFASPVPSLTTRGPFKLRDFELTVEVSNSKMANEAGGGMRANNNNYSRQQQQQQQRHRKQDDRNAHSMMRSNNRNAHVMPSGQTSMRQGSAIHSLTDRSMQSSQAFHAPPLASSLTIPQANSSSSLLQHPSASPAAVVTTSAQANNINASSLHKNEEVEAHGRLQSQTTRREGEEKENHRRTRPKRRQRHRSTSTASQSSRGYDYYHSHSNSASVRSSQRRRSSASVSSANLSASASTLNSHKGSHNDKHSHKHTHRPHRHRRRSSSQSSSSSVGHSPRHHRSRHDETSNNNVAEHSVERSHDKSSTQSHRRHRHKHHRQEPQSNYPHHSASSLIPSVPANNMSGNNTPSPSGITSATTLPQALASVTAHTQEIAPTHNSSQHPTNAPSAGANVAMHEMFVCLPMSLCPAQFMCDPRVFTARLDRSRVGALTICGSVLQAANMLSALQPSAAPSANVSVNGNSTNKVNNNNYSAPPPPPPPPPGPPPPSSLQAPGRLPLASSQNASMPLHSMMQSSKHTSPPPPPPPPPGPPPNSTGGPATVNSGMANQRLNVMRPQGR